jgi:hypothetical protein
MSTSQHDGSQGKYLSCYEQLNGAAAALGTIMLWRRNARGVVVPVRAELVVVNMLRSNLLRKCVGIEGNVRIRQLSESLLETPEPQVV